MEEKLKEVLETPQVHLFKHENVFGNSFKEEINKQAPEFIRLNSVASTVESPLPIMTTTTSINSFSNSSNNSAPKKNILFRTISQTDLEIQRQDQIKLIDSLNNSQGYYSSQNSSTHSILTPEPIDQNISSLINKAVNNSNNENNHNFRLLNDLNSKIDQANNSSRIDLKRKNNEINDFSINLGEKFIRNNSKPYQVTTNNNHGSTTSLVNINQNGNSQINGEKFSIVDNTTNIKKANFEARNGQNNKISNLIQNERIYEKKNPYTPDSLNKSRSSSSSNDEIVTSSDQNLGNKSKPKRSIMLNSDVRKQQIRNSNREAARRCRERRRNYIETLEANIRNLESKQKTLTNENNSLHKEVATLKKTISEYKNCNLDTVNQQNTDKNMNNSSINQLRLVNSDVASIGGVPLVLTLKLPNLDVESGNISMNGSDQITMSGDNENSNINNHLQKFLNALIANNQTHNTVDVQSQQPPN